MHPHLRLRHLRCFLETARLESLSAAATGLRISQPAASRTIRELEDIVGVPLFDRSGRRLVLNPAGRHFQQHAAAAMRELDRAGERARGAPERAVRLSVGLLPTVATDLFPRAALRMRAARPGCLLRVSTGPNWLLLSQLREGTLDLVVGRMPSPDRMTGLRFRQLYSEAVVLVMRPGHPLALSPDLAQDLARYPLLLPPPGAVIAPAVQAWLLSIGMANPMPAFESVSLAFGRKVVQRSDTVWFISQGVVADEVAAGTLVAIQPSAGMLAGPVGICLRADAVEGPDQAALVAALEAEV